MSGRSKESGRRDSKRARRDKEGKGTSVGPEEEAKHAEDDSEEEEHALKLDLADESDDEDVLEREDDELAAEGARILADI